MVGKWLAVLGQIWLELRVLWQQMAPIVTTLAPSFMIDSSLFLQVTRKIIASWMGSKFGKIC